jgi:uncharacterized protein YbjT (DUF2867 family)
MKTLVIGATGLVGGEICRLLTQAGRPVRALIRQTADPAKRGALETLGVEFSVGDLKDPASLARACDGVHSVVSTASSTLSRQAGDSIESVDEYGQLALVDAARKANVGHFVFISFRDNPDLDFPLSAAKRAVERAVKTSGMAYTILQPSYFMEIWLSPALGFDVTNRRVRLYGEGTNPISWIAYRDVARAAASAVTDDAARNMVVELGGPQALSPREVVGMFEAAGAGEIVTETVPQSALESQLSEATDPMQKSFAGLMLQYALGDAVDATVSDRVFPYQKTSLREFINAQLARA